MIRTGVGPFCEWMFANQCKTSLIEVLKLFDRNSRHNGKTPVEKGGLYQPGGAQVVGSSALQWVRAWCHLVPVLPAANDKLDYFFFFHLLTPNHQINIYYRLDHTYITSIEKKTVISGQNGPSLGPFLERYYWPTACCTMRCKSPPNTLLEYWEVSFAMTQLDFIHKSIPLPWFKTRKSPPE